MAKWKKGKLGDFVTVKGGKRLPKGMNLIPECNSHPYIRIKNLGKEKDIVISIVGTIGFVGIIGKSLDKANLTENCVKLINIRGLDKEFLYYYLISIFGQSEIEKGIVGAVQPKLPIKNIQNIIIKYPEFDEQKRIGCILSKIAEKILNNNRINHNLPPHQEWKYTEKIGCGGNEEMAMPFLRLWAA